MVGADLRITDVCPGNSSKRGQETEGEEEAGCMAIHREGLEEGRRGTLPECTFPGGGNKRFAEG